MIRPRSRDRLINAIVYFASNTNYCGKVKLFKLLYLLDFTHFRETGRSVTEMDYVAWKMGPVPLQVEQEWDALDADLAQAIDIVPERVIDFMRQKVVPKRSFDDSHFTRRELAIMKSLVQQFRDEKTRPLVNLTHEQRGPWDAIWDQGRGNNQRIPYSLAIQDAHPHREAILESADLDKGIKAAQQR